MGARRPWRTQPLVPPSRRLSRAARPLPAPLYPRRAAEAVAGVGGPLGPGDLPSARAEFEAGRNEEVKAAENADRKSQVGWGGVEGVL